MRETGKIGKSLKAERERRGISFLWGGGGSISEMLQNVW
jgi:hypothetical protein